VQRLGDDDAATSPVGQPRNTSSRDDESVERGEIERAKERKEFVERMWVLANKTPEAGLHGKSRISGWIALNWPCKMGL